MTQLHNALKIIRTQSRPIGIELISVSESLNRILAEDIFSDINIPPFNKAKMDGFACRRVDLPGPFKVVDEIPAGKVSSFIIGEGECARIMTGAPVPEGADTVIIIEKNETQPDGSILFTSDHTDSNVCLIGEDVMKGETVLKEGTLIRPQDIAVLASVGKDKIKVYSMPGVSVISTGTELIEHDNVPVGGQIRNINGLQMLAQLSGIGINASYQGIVSDNKELIQKSIEEALESNDVVFISGGVSIGDYDLIPQTVLEMGFEISITSIDIKPGRHTILAVRDNKYILGFPGSPVASFVQMELLGKTLLYNLMGHHKELKKYKVIFIDDFERKNSDRLEFLPVLISDTGKAKLIPYNSSGHIHAISRANALMEIPIGVKTVEKGDMVCIRPL